MLLERPFHSLWLHWRLRRMQRLARVNSPTREECQEMLSLIKDTQSKANKWPHAWPPEWYRKFVQSDSEIAHNLCATSSLDGHEPGFIHELLLDVLNKGCTPLMDWITPRLDARTLPKEVWPRLLDIHPLLRCRFLVGLPHIEKLEKLDRAPVLEILAASDPHFWMGEYYSWYRKLSVQWKIVPPEHWWDELYSVDLHQPLNRLYSIPYHYNGLSMTQFLRPVGRTTYGKASLQKHRSTILAPDPWSIVKTAFYGDTSLWPPRPIYSPETLVMYADALAILLQYYPQILTTDFQKTIPDFIRSITPRIEILMFLGFSSGHEAAREFSLWLHTNNGDITCAGGGETFDLDALL